MRRPRHSSPLRSRAARAGVRAVGVALALSLFACATVASPERAPAASPEASAAGLYDQPWQWVDERGEAVAFSRWRGAPLIVTAVYTSCTERCPLTVEKLRRVEEALRRRDVEVQVALVTLDPEHDTLERLQHFRTARNVPPEWHLLRGDREQTHDLARRLRVRAIYDDSHIDHDVRIAVFDAAGHLVRDFTGWDFDENLGGLR